MIEQKMTMNGLVLKYCKILYLSGILKEVNDSEIKLKRQFIKFKNNLQKFLWNKNLTMTMN